MQNVGWKSGAGVETQLFKKIVFQDKKEVPEARTALKWAVAGLFFCGFMLGCVAIVKAEHALNTATLHPGEYASSQTASVAMTLGAIDVVVWAFGLMGLAML